MPVELTNPSGLWVLGLSVPLVLLYILKVRRTRIAVPATWLWETSHRDLEAKNPFRRLRRDTALLIQMLAIVLLSLAIAKPAIRTGLGSMRHVAFVVDTSASMGAMNGGTSRLDEARTRARDAARSLGVDADAMVIDAAHEPRVSMPLDRDRRRLTKVLEALAVRPEQGALGRSVTLAVERLGRTPGEKRVLVFTDDAATVRDAAAHSSVPIDVVVVGKAVDNVGIARFDVRRAVDASTHRARVEAFLLVENFGSRAADRFVVLRQRNTTQAMASRRIRLGPDERLPVVLSFEPAPSDAGTGLIAELDPSDALALDDRAYAIVPPDAALPVVVAPPDASPWVERAFAADADVALHGATLDEIERGAVPDGALVVTVGGCPGAAPESDVLVIDPPKGACLGVDVGDRIERPVVTSWAEDDPRFEFVDFENVHARMARRLSGLGGREASVRAGEATIAASLDIAGAHATLLAFDPGNSDWPLQASFVVFVRNVAELARAARTTDGRAFHESGAPLRFRVPRETSRVTLEDPNELRQEMEVHEGLVVAPAAVAAGFYFASWQSPKPGSVLLAVHFTAGGESDLRGEAAGAPAAGQGRVRPTTTVARVADVSWLLAILAVAFVVLDVWYATRKPRASLEKAGSRS